MSKEIICVGIDIPGLSNSCIDYNSSQSILDADIILFQPDFSGYSSDYLNPTYKGKKSFSETCSFDIKDDTNHWKRELSSAMESGKNIFVFFKKFEEYYIYTGEKQYSGTGRNARQTNIVASFNNYNFLPFNINTLIPKEGKAIVFSGNPLFHNFWTEFKNHLVYESYIDESVANPIFLTKTGNKVTGAIFKYSNGHLILLPVLKYGENKFSRYDSKTDKSYWTKEAIAFGKKLVKCIVEIDKGLKYTGEKTPPPEWLQKEDFELKKEKAIKIEIENIELEISSALEKQKQALSKLDSEVEIKSLLFEKGKVLEKAVEDCLKALGYKVENYNDGNMEIDHIIVSPEGERYIGETEGKDNAPINIEKFRQLAVNIQEDLKREDVNEPAVGILFGNGFRLSKPEERAEQFTTKCVKTAQKLNCILIKTSDLFYVIKKIKENDDEELKKTYRELIKNSIGKIVDFPK